MPPKAFNNSSKNEENKNAQKMNDFELKSLYQQVQQMKAKLDLAIEHTKQKDCGCECDCSKKEE